MVTIRLYRASDRPGYLALQAEVFGEPASHNDPAETLDRVLAVASSTVVVAEIGGALVGAAIGGYDGCRGWLYSIAVHPDSRRQGIGRRLIASVEETLLRRGCPKVNLQVRSENPAAVAFYESLGYRIEDRVSLGKRLPG